MTILGIETSCDETAASVVVDGTTMLSNTIASSMQLHIPYGGVVPEIAARSHIESILPVIKESLLVARQSWQDIDAIAVTKGPGLGGSLLIGVMTARTLAIIKKKPLYGIDHVAAHVAANFIASSFLDGYKFPESVPNFPLLALIVSGGHTQLVLFKSHTDYHLLGQTGDDAIGEAFDKVAKLLGLPYPGGPSVAKAATNGNPDAFTLPIAHMNSPYDFSFSGLKTAVLRLAQSQIGETYDFPSSKLPDRLSEAQKNDIAASFQCTAIKTLVEKTKQAYLEFAPKSVVVAGGVAASTELRRQLNAALLVSVYYPDIKLCTDNAAMIASQGYFQATSNRSQSYLEDPFKLVPNPGLSM